jgi:hypothetical protein
MDSKKTIHKYELEHSCTHQKCVQVIQKWAIAPT